MRIDSLLKNARRKLSLFPVPGLQNPQYGHIRFVHITRRGQAETLIAALKSYS
jgi:hypothetical protein